MTTTTGERLTAALSTIAAIALLGAAVTAQPSAHPAVERLATLESDLRFQIDQAYRHDGGMRRAREAQLEATLDAWRRSTQSEADGRALAGWLRESILRSLPGELREFPATPEFGKLADPAVKKPQSPPADVVVDAASAQAAASRPTGPLVPIAQTERSTEKLPAAPAAKPARPVPGAGPANPPLVHRLPPRSQTPIVDLTPAKQVAPPRKPPAATAAAAPPIEHSIAVRRSKSAAQPTVVASQQRPAAPVQEAKPATPIPSAPPSVKPIAVNLSELNARIVGYHEALDEIDAAIVANHSDISPEQIESLIASVEKLAGQYRFVRLYYDALTDAERQRVTAPRTMTPTIELVARERSRAMDSGNTGDFLTLVEEDSEDELAQRLQAVAKLVAP